MNCNHMTNLRVFRLKPMIFVAFLLVSFGSFSQNPQEYIDFALRHNPVVKAADKEISIAQEKISEAASLSNTEFSASYALGKSMPMMEKSAFSVMQYFPWFGSISARKELASAGAEAGKTELELLKKQLVFEISQRYYQLFGLQKTREILDDKISLLTTYEEMAVKAVETGKTSMVYVLKLQMKKDELENERQVVTENLQAEKIRFNKLLNRPENEEILLPESLSVSEETRDEDPGQLDAHPEVRKFEKLSEIASFSDQVNRKESAPQLGVGMEYALYTDYPDMVMPMVSLSIPIFTKKYKSVARQNQLYREQLVFQQEARKNELLGELEAAIRNRNAARFSYRSRLKNLEQVRNATKILLSNYAAGIVDFRELLDLQELELDYSIKQLEALVLFYEQSAKIDYFLKEE